MNKEGFATRWKAMGDAVVFTTMERALYFKSNSHYSERQWNAVQEIIYGLQEEKKMSFGQYAAELLGDRNLEIEGEENIPGKWPLLIISNHAKHGGVLPLVDDFTQVCMVDSVIRKARPQNSPRWIQAAETDNPLVKILPPVRAISRMINTRIGHSFGTILVDREGGNKYQNSLIQAANAWRRGEITPMHPEGTINSLLQDIDPRAQEFLFFSQTLPEKIRPTIIPIIGLLMPESATVKVGKPVILQENQTAEDFGIEAMQAMAALLPPDKVDLSYLRTREASKNVTS